MAFILETQRLLLRKFTLNDFEDLYNLSCIKKVQKYTGEPVLKNLLEAKKIISNVIEVDYLKYGYGRWAVIYKAENKLIGAAGLKYLPEIDQTDIGFRFLPSYWGRGIATEAAIKITKYGFHKLSLTKILGFVIPQNIASCRVLEKAGYTFEKQHIYPTDKKIYNWYYICK